MTTEASGAPAAPAAPPSPVPSPSPAPEPQPQGGAPYADHEAAVRRDQQQHADRTAAMTPSEIQALADKFRNDPNSDFYKGGKDHDFQVAVSFKAHELDAAKAEGPTEERTASQRLSDRAMNLAGILPKEALANPKIIDGDVEMQNLTKWADSEGVSTPVLRDLIAEAANHGIALGPLSEQAMDSLEAKFRGRLRDDQIALLRRWAVAELNPALAREAARRRGR